MRRRRNTLPSMSAAAVDLLSCGLAAAAVLWLLVLPNNGLDGIGQADRVNGVVRIGQYGTDHLFYRRGHQATIEVHFPGDPKPSVFQLNNEGAIQVDSGMWQTKTEVSPITRPFSGKTPKVKLATRKGVGGIASEIDVVFRDVKPGTEVKLSINVCTASETPHPIAITTIDRQGANSFASLWTTLTSFEAQTSKGNHDNNFVGWLKANPAVLDRHTDKLLSFFFSTNADSPQTMVLRATSSALISIQAPGIHSDGKTPSEKGTTVFDDLEKWVRSSDSGGGDASSS